MKYKNQYFLRIYNAHWHYGTGEYPGRWNAYVWKQLFGGSPSANLPRNKEEWQGTIQSADNETVVTLKLRPCSVRDSRKHRVFVECQLCGKDVQAGRIAQHKC